jgi:mRNA-degrading endonuclease RelE of RelBE toxin-antitoxin system
VSAELRLDIPPHVADVIRALPPDVKQAVKEGLRLLSRNPTAGEPLRRELEGYRQYRVRRFRIVYQATPRAVRIVASDIAERSTSNWASD